MSTTATTMAGSPVVRSQASGHRIFARPHCCGYRGSLGTTNASRNMTGSAKATASRALSLSTAVETFVAASKRTR